MKSQQCKIPITQEAQMDREAKPEARFEPSLMSENYDVIPTANKVAIIRDSTPEDNMNIWIPQAVKESIHPPPLSGTVASVGSAIQDVNPGDYVVFSGYAGANVRVDGTTYIIMKVEDIHAVLRKNAKG